MKINQTKSRSRVGRGVVSVEHRDVWEVMEPLCDLVTAMEAYLCLSGLISPLFSLGLAEDAV